MAEYNINKIRLPNGDICNIIAEPVEVDDTKVSQSNVSASSNIKYPIILAYDNSTSAVTNTVKKSSNFTYNPYTGNLVVGTVNNYTLAEACEKAIDTSISNTSSTNLPTSAAVADYVTNNGGTDTKVTQSATITTNSSFPILLAYSTSTSAITNTVNKSSTLKYNPSTKALVTGGTVDGLTFNASTTSFTIKGGSSTARTLTINNSYTLGDACAKGVDTSISDGSTSTNLPTAAAVASFVESKGYITSDDVTTGVTDVKAPYSSTSAVTKVTNGIATLNVASTSYYGLTKLSSSTSSTSTSLAATPSAVKIAYDKAVSAYDKGVEFIASGSYSASSSAGTISGQISDDTLTSGKIYVIKMDAATTDIPHSVQFKNASGTNLTSYPLYTYGTTQSNQVYPSGTVLMFVYYNSAFYLINPFAVTA